jgi:hypothetical protein
LCNRTAEWARLDVVGEPPPAVDLDHGEPLPVARLELRIAGDVNLAEVEVELLAEGSQLLERTLAEVTPRRVVDDDLGSMGKCHA